VVFRSQVAAVHLKDITLEPLARSNEGLSLGDLQGNRFDIVIRNPDLEDLEDRVRSVSETVATGVPNYFGLVGAEANAVAPGKPPLSSMTPTIVLEQGKPILALGAAGGPRIISCVFAQLVGILDLGQSPAEAMAAPRIHHQWSPDEVAVEQSLPDGIQNALRSRGHKLLEQNALSAAHSVSRTPDRRAFTGAADPRSRGTAQGW